MSTTRDMAIAAMRKLDGAKWHDIDVPDIEATLTALRDAGYAVVKLPPASWSNGLATGWTNSCADEIVAENGRVFYADDGMDVDLDSIGAREVAAALLAAADAAERGES